MSLSFNTSTPTPTGSSPLASWIGLRGQNNATHFSTPRYDVTIGKDHNNEGYVEIKDKETGQVTKIWGDPHINLPDGTSVTTHGDENITIQLNDGTKITMDTKDVGKGLTLVDSVTVTTDDGNSFTASNLSGSGDIKTDYHATGGQALDDQVEDGMTINLHDGHADINGQAVNQQVVDKAEKDLKNNPHNNTNGANGNSNGKPASTGSTNNSSGTSGNANSLQAQWEADMKAAGWTITHSPDGKKSYVSKNGETLEYVTPGSSSTGGSGNSGSTVSNAQNAVNQARDQSSTLQRVQTDQMMEDATGMDGQGGKYAKKKNFFMMLALVLGSALDREADKVQALIDKVQGGDDSQGTMAELSAEMQRLSFMSSQTGAIISAMGSGLRDLGKAAQG